MTSTRQQNLRTFYFIIITQTLSIIGSRISGLAIGFHIFNQTGEATPLTLVSFFSLLPMVLASGVSGVLADRWDRRYVMMIADFGQAAGTVLLLISFLSGDFQLWHLYVVTVVQAVFGVFQGPAFNASLTMLIPDEQRNRANAITQLTQPLAGIIAPGIAGMIFAAFGVIGAILLDLVSFGIAIAAIIAVRIPRPPMTAEGQAMRGSIWREMVGGFQYLNQRRSLLFLMFTASILNFLFMLVVGLQTPYLLSRTGSEATMGLILSVMNLGGLVGGIIIGVWGGTRPRMRTVIPALFVSGMMLALSGVSQAAIPLGITLFLMLLPLPMINTSFMSIFQAKVAPDIQGRVFAVMGQISMLLSPLAVLISGPLADRVFEPAVESPGWAVVAPLVGSSTGAGIGLMIVLAGLAIVGMSLVVLSVRSIRELESILPDHVVTPAPVAAAVDLQPDLVTEGLAG